ncbi:hypothetical protein PR202_gb05918 [Eleusine coracana subsp. coracana]|uniref:RRM domain-containing protein n=1 Tax=Eleusine coracana subsp. coracana TaxID=191504 RepID=A0AAV5E7Y6_ELECO|nr:hypothetical protein PR202_gb05918 [Eleusine coracana subsp. coracana]
MGSLPRGASAPSPGDLVTTQVSLGGFDATVSARDLADFLEFEAGQATAPPPYDRVPPHAFVHFARPEAARRAADAAGRSELLLARKPLRAASAPESSLRASRRRQTAPFRSPSTLSTDCCRFVFARDTAFAFPGFRGVVVMRCDVKLEFPVRDIAEVRVFRTDCSLLIRLWAAPLVFYRTADDDIYESGAVRPPRRRRPMDTDYRHHPERRNRAVRGVQSLILAAILAKDGTGSKVHEG